MNGSKSTIDWRSDAHALKKFQFIYHFLPHPKHNRRATLLSNKSIFVYCLLILFAGVVFRLFPVYLPGILGYASNINTSDLLKYTNQKREEAGLGGLQINSKLSQAAQKKAEHMLAKGYWAHVAPDGTEPWDFILGAGYDYVYAGENLAKNFSSSKDVVQAWYNSPSHKQNLLNTNYQEVGYAAVNGVLNGYETTLVVQMFGKPRLVAAGSKPVYQIETQTVTLDEEVKDIKAEVVQQPVIYQQIEVTPTVDVRKATRILSAIMAGFVMVLLTLDLWYSKKLGITKINGSTLAHLCFLILVIISIWFVLKPGAIL